MTYYEVLLSGKDLIKEYHVSGFPTLFLIDATGKILHVQVGYSKEIESDLEELIKKHLANAKPKGSALFHNCLISVCL